MPDRSALLRLVKDICVPHRQVFLFVVAVCLPCCLLLFLGARTIVQDRELSEKRLADRREQLAGAVARALLDRLERIKVEEASAYAGYLAGLDNDRLVRGATVFVAQVVSGRPQMAWTTDPYAIRAGRALAVPAFADQIARGVEAELAVNNRGTAVRAFRAALQNATDPAQAAYAEVLLGRVLRSAHSPLANVSYGRVLHLPLTVRDEQGIPFALYAAKALEGDGSMRRDVDAVVQKARADLLFSRSLSLSACYAIADLNGSTEVRGHCLDLERAHEITNDASALVILGRPDVRWAATANGRWLTSIAPRTSTHPSILLAVRIDSLAEGVASLAGNEMSLVLSSGKTVRPIGHGLEGVGVRWSSDESATGRRISFGSAFYIALLGIVMGSVLLSAYLLWRDVRRELRLAQLRSHFVSSVSHELKTPLTSIRLFAETLRDRPNLDPRARYDYLETIARESDRLTRLLQNVLDFSRIERADRTYNLSPQPLPIIVERALQTMRFSLEQQKFTVRFECDDEFAIVRCDSDAVEQAIINLVSNAMKYSGKSRRIDVQVEHRADAVAVVVRDYGIGIAPIHQQSLFERFYRAPTPDNDVIPGTGLGLTLVHHLAEAHGAVVSVASVVGRGSSFTLSFPAIRRAAGVDEFPLPTSQRQITPS